MWFGTSKGPTRYNGGVWHLRRLGRVLLVDVDREKWINWASLGGESQLISIYDSGSFHIPIIDIRKNLHYGIVLHISYTVDWEPTSNVHMSTGGTCFSALREDGKINVKELDTEKYEGGTAGTSPGDAWSGGKETHSRNENGACTLLEKWSLLQRKKYTWYSGEIELGFWMFSWLSDVFWYVVLHKVTRITP